MKLLLDQNISSKITEKLQSDFQGSAHVKEFNLTQRSDILIWEFAKHNDFIIVTRDADFFDIGLIQGYPPKIIWIQTNNPSKEYTENLLLTNKDIIYNFVDESETFCLRLL